MPIKAEKLRQLMKSLDLKPSAFERECLMSNGVIKKAIDRDGDVTADMIEKILAKFPDINKAWLLTGEGNMFINDTSHYKKKEEPMNEKILQMLEKELERNDQRWNNLLTAHNKLIDSLAEKRELVKH